MPQAGNVEFEDVSGREQEPSIAQKGKVAPDAEEMAKAQAKALAEVDGMDKPSLVDKIKDLMRSTGSGAQPPMEFSPYQVIRKDGDDDGTPAPLWEMRLDGAWCRYCGCRYIDGHNPACRGAFGDVRHRMARADRLGR